MAAFSTRKYAACILFALLVAINHPSAVDAGYTMNETCAYLASGYIADPTNCQAWGYCQGGMLVKTGLCGTGLLYDSTTGMCNYQNQVTCFSNVQNICANMADPGYVADPNNCNGYSYCANGVVVQTFNCPINQVYNSYLEQCVWSSSYQCPANSICRLVQNNAFVGDPVTCGNYLRCQDGAGASTACTVGKFNPLKGGCDPNYSCTIVPGVPGTPSTPNVPLQNQTICANNYKTGGDAIQYFSDYTTCYGFYACASATAVGQWGSCPFATHFNGEYCVSPYTYACPWDRCGNLNLPFVAEIGCTSYAVCSNQVTVAEGSCAASNALYPYFDEYGQGCVSSPITNQAICTATDPAWPPPATTTTTTTTTTKAPGK